VKQLIRQWIEALHHNGQCARLMVDATADGVVVPEHIKEQWGEAMPIDLDPAFPLELTMDEGGIDCVLSFGGPHACHLPWRSIYVVQDRDSQIGVVIEENLPPRFALETEEHVAPGGREAPAEGPRAPRPQAAVAEVEEGLGEVDADGDDEEAGAEGEAAARRRASFKVIDGGKS
jgi:stringent starvation protein B